MRGSGDEPVGAVEVAEFAAFANAYWADPALRARADAGVDIPASAEARIVANTKEVFHFVLPSYPNSALTDTCSGPSRFFFL